MSKYINWDILKTIWKRLTASKVAWMALPAGLAMILTPFLGKDVSPQLEALFAGLWTILSIYLATNDPTTPNSF